MTVPAGQVPIVTYSNVGPSMYDFSFKIFKETDLIVSHIDSTGIRNTLVLGDANDYYVGMLDDGVLGGTITLLTTLTGGSIEIRRRILCEQPTDWNNNNAFNTELLEIDLDRSIMIIQEIQTIIDNKFVYSNWRGDWSTATDYTVNTVVTGSDTNIYVAIVDHTSSDFTNDLAAGYWLLVVDIVSISNYASQSASSASSAATSETNAATSETNAATSETNAATSETNAATSETNAATSETNAATSEANAATSEANAEAIVAAGDRIDAVYTDSYAATAGQIDFTITHVAAEDNIIVFMNSRKLRLAEDFVLDSSTAATKVSLNSPAEVGDEVDIISFNTYGITGYTGTYINGTGDTVTVVNGLITQII